MLGADFRGGGRYQSGEGRDQLAGLIQVLEVLGVGVVGQADFYGRRTHQVDGAGGDDLHGRYFRDVADLLGDAGVSGRGGVSAKGVAGIAVFSAHTGKLVTDRLEVVICSQTIPPPAMCAWRVVSVELSFS